MAGWGYDVVGALDATPGTEELRAVAARVERVDTGALADLARRYAALADGMDTSARAVAERGEGIGRAWQGPGADAFARYTADFARAGTDTGDVARRVQGELAGLGRTLAALREEVAGHVSDALDLARARPEQVRVAVAIPTARARAALDRAEQEVADCARRVRDLADGFTGFSRLRSPDAGVMSSSGATSRWSDRQDADPVREARIPDEASGASGSAGAVDRGTGDDGTASAGSSGDEGATSDDGERGSRADAADPGNAERYDDSGADDTRDDDEASRDEAEQDDAADDTTADDDSATGADDTGSAERTGEDDDVTGRADEADRDQADQDQDAGATSDEKSDDTTDDQAPDQADAEQETGTDPSSGRGGVQDWIRQATAILAENGVDPDAMRAEDIATIIEHESGGDPDAVNDWDSNAAKGTPSKGLMQTIGPTFEANKLPGHDDITDPVDNIIAAVRYAIRRYGSVSEVPGVQAVARGDAYVGY